MYNEKNNMNVRTYIYEPLTWEN